MDNLQLVPMGEGLILEWDRPSNAPIEVAVNYTVTINSADENITVYNENLYTVNQTSVSLQFLENQLRKDRADCIMFEFSVSGSNDAGTGQPTKIVDTIPLCKIALKCGMHKLGGHLQNFIGNMQAMFLIVNISLEA